MKSVMILMLVPFTVFAQDSKPEVASEVVPAARAQEMLKALIRRLVQRRQFCIDRHGR
jgi:hypothetical protein